MQKHQPNGTGAGSSAEKMPLPPVSLEPMLEASQRGLRATSAAQAHVLRRLAEMNAEILGFVERRLEKDRATAAEVAACTSAPEVYAVMAKFVEGAVRDYADEMGQLAGLCAEQTREVIEDVQHQVQEAAAPTETPPAGRA